MMSATAEKLSAENYHVQQIEDERKARKIREMNDAAQEARDELQLMAGGGTAIIDPTLRDHAQEAREAAIERTRNADAFNALASKTLEPGEEEMRKARVRDFESCFGETMDRFGEAEPENKDFLGDRGSPWSGRPNALCRARYIGNECWNGNRSIEQTDKNIVRVVEQLEWRLKRFDGAEVDDDKIQSALSYAEDLARQKAMWTDFMLAACNIYHEETGTEWKPLADGVNGGKNLTAASSKAAAFIARYAKKKTS